MWKALHVLGVALMAVGQMMAAEKEIQRTDPTSLHPPRGYNHVITVTSGRTVYIAGRVPLDVKSQLVGKSDFTAQTRQVFKNIKNALASVGATFSDVISMITYVTDISQIEKYRAVRDEYMKSDLPTASRNQQRNLPDIGGFGLPVLCLNNIFGEGVQEIGTRLDWMGLPEN